MQNEVNFVKSFKEKRKSRKIKEELVDSYSPQWSYPEKQQNIPIKKRTHIEKELNYKKVLCNRKYTTHCFMGSDCTFMHLDEDPQEVEKKDDNKNLSYCIRNKKTKLEENRPRLDENRPRLVENRPRLDENRPKLVENIPKRDEKRPYLKDDRLFLEKNLPYLKDDRPKHYSNTKKLNKKSKKSKPNQIWLDESCYYFADSKQIGENQLENGFCHKLNTFAIGCNMYSNLIGNYVIKKNLSAVYLCSELLNNLNRIENNAIILKCLLNQFPVFKKVYICNGTAKIAFAAHNPIYKIDRDDSIETREEKLKIINHDKLQYTNMVIAHQSSVINAIYKHNNYADISIFTPLINHVSKHFIVDLYLQSYYRQYREPVTDELCESLFAVGENVSLCVEGLNAENSNVETLNMESLNKENPIAENLNLEILNKENSLSPQDFNIWDFMESEFVKQEINPEPAEYNDGFSDEFKQYLRYFQN